MSPRCLIASILDLLFPQFCINCQREGCYLCPDCFSLLEISDVHQKHRGKNLNDVYFALPYKDPLIKKLVRAFKYPPFIKELAQVLSEICLLYTSPSPRDLSTSRMPSSA